MLELMAAAVISQADYFEQVNRFCAYVVGIPYGSGNISEKEWDRFVYCREHLEYDN